jgi:hypothetical protein
MKNLLRLTALVAVLVLSFFTLAKPAYALTDCTTKDGSTCTSPGANGYCNLRDDQCSYIYPCWCESNYLGGYAWRCGSSPIQENCSF